MSNKRVLLEISKLKCEHVCMCMHVSERMHARVCECVHTLTHMTANLQIPHINYNKNLLSFVAVF